MFDCFRAMTNRLQIAEDSRFRDIVQSHLDRLHDEPKRSPEEEEACRARIKELLAEKDAVIVAHYYTEQSIQALAEETGGIVSDSLEMARFGKKHPASTLLVCGVRFMGETAKILTPDKRVLMPTLEATCSLDIGCPAEDFAAFCDQHPDRTVVVYANTSAAVKARADWVVTSSIAVDVVDYLDSQGEKILWGPDKHLGRYIQKKVGADMLLWDGSCIVHEEFKFRGILDVKKMYPDAAVLVHPESPEHVVALADAVGSTSQLIEAARTLPHKRIIVATDEGIFYKMRQLAPEKELIIAPTAGHGATCRSCANCPWMAMNHLDNMAHSLESGSNEVVVDPELGRRAMVPLQRMLDFREKQLAST